MTYISLENGSDTWFVEEKFCFQMTNTALKIDNPCPVSLLAMRKDGENYHCKFCQKKVIDFRAKTQEEIVQEISPDVCGIFYNYQLPAQPRLGYSGRMRLFVLGLFSILGFQVNGWTQTTKSSPKVVEQKQLPGKKPVNDSLPVCPVDKRKEVVPPVEKKKTVFRTVGCPSF